LAATQESRFSKMRKEGISVLVCCYNSARRIETTLKHLFVQKLSIKINWEIIVVNNNSTDNTRQVAEEYHQQNGNNILFNVVDEPQPGLSHAREKGFSTAQFNIALMVDDDNSLSDDYLMGIWNRFTSDKHIGMVGGKGIPVLEGVEPAWFAKYASCYATGDQHPESNSISDLLYGAGLALRLDVLDNLKKNGFRSILSDRTGSNLMSGGDTELCLMYRMAGYELIYNQTLTFEHHLPEARISWEYLRRLFIGFGMTKARTEIYAAAMANNPLPKDGRLSAWFNRATYLLRVVIKDAPMLIKSSFLKMEGNSELLAALARLGHLREIIRMQKEYQQLYEYAYDLKRNLSNSKTH